MEFIRQWLSEPPTKKEFVAIVIAASVFFGVIGALLF